MNYGSIGKKMGYSGIKFNYIIKSRVRYNILVWVLREILYRHSGSMSDENIDECYNLLAMMVDSGSRGGRLVEQLYLDNYMGFNNPTIDHLVRSYIDSNPKGLKFRNGYKIHT